MKRVLFYAVAMLLMVSGMQCRKENNNNNNNNGTSNPYQDGVLILDQGSFQGGNAQVDFLTRNQELSSDIFAVENNRPMGDVLQSATAYNGQYYFVMNGSSSILVTDGRMKLKGSIENLGSPRYIQVVSAAKAYVSDLSNNGIWIIDPTAMSKTGKIDYAPQGGGYKSWTEQMALSGSDLFVTAPGPERLLVINTLTDKITDSITMQGQPQWIVKDGEGRLWVLTNGQFTGDSSTLYSVDAASRKISATLRFPNPMEGPMFLAVDKSGEHLFYIHKNAVYRMSTADKQLPTQAWATLPAGCSAYALAVDPKSGEVYVGDAVDYKSAGKVLRYSTGGILVDTKAVGVAPGGFYFAE
jgi:DNA-binding beta-propeller fold protein YncE